MPQALAVAVRQTIVERHLAGASLPAIARALGLSPWTVRTLWRRYRDRGDAGLVPDYAACGRPGPRHPQPLYAHALLLRRCPTRRHSGAGSGTRDWPCPRHRPGPPLRHGRRSPTSAGNWMPPSKFPWPTAAE